MADIGEKVQVPTDDYSEIICQDFSEKLLDKITQLFIPVAEMEMLNRKQYLTEKEVSQLFSVSATTLRAERSRGHGPGYVKDRRKVLCPRKELMAYYSKRLVRTHDPFDNDSFE